MEKQMRTRLENEGWHLQEQVVEQLLQSVSNVEEGGVQQTRDLEGAVRMLLLDSDMKRVGARCLPDGQSLLQTRTLQGVRVLQIVSVNDISQSPKKATAGDNQHSRLLRFRLSDGHSTVTAIEFHPISTVSQDLPPGTKVVLRNSVLVHTGVLLLDANCIRVLGGHVQALYDAWEMDRKYSGVAREMTSKAMTPEGVSGPPPFRALQLGRKTRPSMGLGLQAVRQDNNSRSTREDSSREISSKEHIKADKLAPVVEKKEDVASKPKPTIRPGAELYRPRVRLSATDATLMSTSVPIGDAPLPPTITEVTAGGNLPSSSQPNLSKTTSNETSSSEKLPSDIQSGTLATSPSVGSSAKVDNISNAINQNIKNAISLGIDTAPLQNQKAAQKLLEKSVDTNWRRGDGRGLRGRGRGSRRGGRSANEREDDAAVMTLDEWEAKQSNGSSNVTAAKMNLSGGSYATDGELALRLQQQLDIESAMGGTSKQIDAAQQLRLSMFNFTTGGNDNDDTRERGRGRGHHRGRGRGRGRGRQM